METQILPDEFPVGGAVLGLVLAAFVPMAPLLTLIFWTPAIDPRWMSKKIVAPKIRWKGCDQAAVLRTALLHSEGVEHLGRAFKHDLRRLLPDRLRRQEDRNQAILSPRQSVAGMARDLKKKMPITALVKQLSGFGSFHR